MSKLLPYTRRSLFADDFMIYSESSITRSDLIQSNFQTSMYDLTLFNADHRIILSCTKSVRVLFERKKSNRLKLQDVIYNGQVIPSSSSVKFLGVTSDSALIFRSHFRTVATLACHRFLKLNSIFSSTYGPSYNVVGRGYKLISFLEHFPSHHSSTTAENGNTLTFPIHDRNLYLAKRWYSRAMQHNRGVPDYIDNHTRNKRNNSSARTTPL